jgi:hypothetical protein
MHGNTMSHGSLLGRIRPAVPRWIGTERACIVLMGSTGHTPRRGFWLTPDGRGLDSRSRHTMSHPGRCFPLVILIAASCASSVAPPGATAFPVDPAGAGQLGEATPVESPIDLAPYVGRRPLARVSQDSYWGHSPSFDFVVYDDGAVFFEGISCVAELGLRRATLSPTELTELKALAEPRCAELFRPSKEGSRMAMCTHIDNAMVSCTTADGDLRRGWDCRGSELFSFARGLTDKAKVQGWIGTRARREASCRSGKRYSATQIDRMIFQGQRR